MRLLTFAEDNGPARLGVMVEGQLFDMHGGNAELPGDLLSFIRQRETYEPLLRAFVAAPPERARVTRVWQHLPPIIAPGKVLCIGVNYHDHAAEMETQAPSVPEIFAKFPSTLIGHEADVIAPPGELTLDFEAELAVVIGRRAHRVERDQALRYVAGYTLFNDVTVRAVQLRTTQWTLGKNYDTHGPMGPWMVTADEIPDPQTLRVQMRVNGEMLQDGATSDMLVDVPGLIELLSGAMTLEPGDVIATGTPSGVGAGRKPPLWLKPGDEMTVSVEGIGELTNVVRAAAGDC